MGDAGANHCLCTLPVQVEQALCFHVIRKGPAFPAVAFKLHYFFSNSLEKEKKGGLHHNAKQAPSRRKRNLK